MEAEVFNSIHAQSKIICDDDSQISLRDYFAAKAMQGIYSSPTTIRMPDGSVAADPLTDEMIAMLAYSQADAMLKAREM